MLDTSPIYLEGEHSWFNVLFFSLRFMIDDHNVPSLSEMLRFADNVRDWLSRDPENVIVVHCKGKALRP